MRLRIRNTFKNRDNATLEEKANILAYNIWQISLAGAKNLHEEDYHFASDAQRVGVIREYLVFMVHIADRMVYDELNETERTTFVNVLAQYTAKQIQRNTEEIAGPEFDDCDGITSGVVHEHPCQTLADDKHIVFGTVAAENVLAFSKRCESGSGGKHLDLGLVEFRQ